MKVNMENPSFQRGKGSKISLDIGRRSAELKEFYYKRFESLNLDINTGELEKKSLKEEYIKLCMEYNPEEIDSFLIGANSLGPNFFNLVRSNNIAEWIKTWNIYYHGQSYKGLSLSDRAIMVLIYHKVKEKDYMKGKK